MSGRKRTAVTAVLQCVEKVVVGAIIDRPQILLKQNLSPQGESLGPLSEGAVSVS